MIIASWIAAVAVVALLASMVGALEAADRVAAALSSRYSDRRAVRLGSRRAGVVDVTDEPVGSGGLAVRTELPVRSARSGFAPRRLHRTSGAKREVRKTQDQPPTALAGSAASRWAKTAAIACTDVAPSTLGRSPLESIGR